VYFSKQGVIERAYHEPGPVKAAVYSHLPREL